MPRPKEFDRDEALDKALELFWHKGYEATSIQDLVEYMGISRGSLYDTFNDKHSLFLAALDRYKQNSHTRFHNLFEQTASVKEAIAQFLTNIIDEAVADTKQRGCFMTNSTIELAPHDPETAERAILNRENVENLFYQALVQAQAYGEISAQADPRALAQFLFSNIQGLRVVAKTTRDRNSLERIMQVTLSVLD